MPRADFGQDVNLGFGSQFIRLKSKGDKVKFRLAKGAIYEGKHFSVDAKGDFVVSFCPRIMAQKECEFCKKYAELRQTAKEETNEAKKKKILQEASKKWGVKVSFYFPVVDREDGKAKVLQTSLSVRTKLEAMVEAGVNVLDSDFVLLRTEAAGADYYSLVRVDSKDTKELSKEEEAELKKAKDMDLEAILGHKVNESHMEME